VERYIVEETIEFFSEYIEKAKPVGLPESCHDERVRGKGSRGLHVITPSVEDLQVAHLYVLNNSNEVLPYILRLEGLVKESNPKMSKNRVLKEHNKTFLNWFKDTIFGDDNGCETLRKLSNDPKRNFITWQGYDINNYSFYTKAQHEKITMQNSGVTQRAESQHFASVHDGNPRVASIPYFGFVATYPMTGVQAKSKGVSSKKKTRGSHHQHLFKENIRKTKKRSTNFENKGLGVVYT